jgi:hypothetical protein
MTLAAVALDYDGTITNGDRPDDSVRDAIAALRSRGVLAFIVTGRILSELVRVAGDLHFRRCGGRRERRTRVLPRQWLHPSAGSAHSECASN